MWILAVLAGCEPAAIEVGKGPSYDVDSAVDSADTAGDTGELTQDTGDTEVQLETDFSTFTGTTHFLYQGWISCDETVTNTGTELTSTDAVYASLQANCTTCTHFYRVAASQGTVCTMIPVGTTYRAMFFSGNVAAVYVYADDGRGGVYQVSSAPSGTFDGANLAYAYTFNIMGADIGVEDAAVFPQK